MSARKPKINRDKWRKTMTTEEFELLYGKDGCESAEEISERLRVEYGAALAEAEGATSGKM
jgi:hypothetical protein